MSDKFADQAWLIYTVYVAAFIPLASIHALDFITDRWATIRDTRRNGILQVIASLFSLSYLVFYIIHQIRDSDHKEAAAAIAVTFFNSYHVLRTIWGLIQLYEFRNWNIDALRCLLRIEYAAPRYEYVRSEKAVWIFSRCFGTSTPVASSSTSDGTASDGYHTTFVRRLVTWLDEHCLSVPKRCFRVMEGEDRVAADTSNLSPDEIKMTIDNHMVVNSTLIDNEFFGSKIPIRADLFPELKFPNPARESRFARFVASHLKAVNPGDFFF